MELYDLTWNLNFSWESFELLVSRLKEKNLLQPGTLITFYRKYHSELLPYFTQENEIAYCNDVAGLLRQFGVQRYKLQNWRLFIDSSKRSLRCVLLHKGNSYGSVPLGHLTTLKERYDEIKFVLVKISYKWHQRIICVDMKMVGFLFGLQSGYTKFPCFLCLLGGRARKEHWTRKGGPGRKAPISHWVKQPPILFENSALWYKLLISMKQLLIFLIF